MMCFEGEEGFEGAEGAGEAAGLGQGQHCEEAGGGDAAMHAGIGESSGPGEGLPSPPVRDEQVQQRLPHPCCKLRLLFLWPIAVLCFNAIIVCLKICSNNSLKKDLLEPLMRFQIDLSVIQKCFLLLD